MRPRLSTLTNWLTLLVLAFTHNASADTNVTSFETYPNDTDPCRLLSVDPKMYDKIRKLVGNFNPMANAKLIKYSIEIANYTVNPLLVNMSAAYKSNIIYRSSSKHGETLLHLAFNYDILSLHMLSFGTERLHVVLRDQPAGCLGQLNETSKIKALMKIIMRDFKPFGYPTLKPSEEICRHVVKNDDGFAKFGYSCCNAEGYCEIGAKNKWIQFLDILLIIFKIVVFIFGPLWISNLLVPYPEKVPYVVKLKEKLYMKLYVATDKIVHLKAKQTLNVTDVAKTKILRQQLLTAPRNKPVSIAVENYHISVDYKRLLTEYEVPVGLMEMFYRLFFLCKIRHVGPFVRCCATSLFGRVNRNSKYRWIHFFRALAGTVLVLLIPLPYYIRLMFYYLYEHQEILVRKREISELGLKEPFRNNLLQYLGPAHPFYVTIYIIYFTTCSIFGILVVKKSWSFRRVYEVSFRDLQGISHLKAFNVVTWLFILPFETFGVFGLIVGIFWWPVALICGFAVLAFYGIPLVYLTFRMLIYTNQMHSGTDSSKTNINANHSDGDSLDRKNNKKSCGQFCSSMMEKGKLHEISPVDPTVIAVQEEDEEDNQTKNALMHLIIGILCILVLYGIMFILSECAAFGVEIAVFTTMGIIVNASTTLRYVMLGFLVLMYCYDCFRNVTRTYETLNRQIFQFAVDRVGKELFDVTSLPSNVQQNQAFKACECSEQQEHELPDGFAAKKRHLEINDLILFLDSMDTPRIPRKLFEDICPIEVAGSPGPIYRNLIRATGRFITIVIFLFFVLLVVMAFGSIYKISSTNQTLATLAGGMLPFVLRNFLNPAITIDLKTVSFKAKVDEVIDNFKQNWHYRDFEFKVEEPEVEKSDDDEEDDDKEKEADDDKSDKSEAKIKGMKTESYDDEESVDLLVNLFLDSEKKSSRYINRNWPSLAAFEYSGQRDVAETVFSEKPDANLSGVALLPALYAPLASSREGGLDDRD